MRRVIRQGNILISLVMMCTDDKYSRFKNKIKLHKNFKHTMYYVIFIRRYSRNENQDY